MTSHSQFMPGFDVCKTMVNGVGINYAIAGTGPGLLLLHGHPQTHVVWRKVAGDLVDAGFCVVAADLRGYGDSDKPPGDPRHATYSKREMARDQIELMAALGFDTFCVVGHDRGGRVAHRLALDYPDAIEKVVVVDIAPTATMYALTDKEFATRYFWWFFLIQPADFPERMIGRDPEYFLRRHIAGQVKTKGAVSEEIFLEYLRCYQDPDTIRAICEDYRAAASIDLEHDAADAHVKLKMPLLALWGAKGVVGELYDVLQTWRDKAECVQGAALNCGHAVQEEVPKVFTKQVLAFLKAESRSAP